MAATYTNATTPHFPPAFTKRAGEPTKRVSVRRECLDHLLLLGERHLRRALGEHVAYFNQARPHQGIGQAIPERATPLEQQSQGGGRVNAIPVLGGLHHDDRRVG